MFKGLSTLRKQERKAAANSEEAKKLQAYLSKYTSGTCLMHIHSWALRSFDCPAIQPNRSPPQC